MLRSVRRSRRGTTRRETARSTPRGTGLRPDRSRSRPASKGRAPCRRARPSRRARAGRSSSNTSTFMPSARHWISPRHTGPVGLPSTKQEMMSVPPEIEASCTSRFTSSIDVIEAFRRRAASRSRAIALHRRRGRAMRAGSRPSLAAVSMNLADVPNTVMRSLVRVIEEHRGRRRRTASRRRAAASRPTRAPTRASSTSSSRRS